MSRLLPLSLASALAYGALAVWVARGAGARWLWVAAASVVVGVALLGASRVGTANPFSRTARWDPLLFFVIAAVFLAAPVGAASLAAAGAVASGDGAVRASLLSAALFLLALPVGFVAAVAVEVLWPH